MELSLDLETLRTAFASGELTPVALIEQIYARIERGDHPNVWIHLAPKAEVLALAKGLGAFDGKSSPPLWGIPFGVKDNIDVAGMPTTAACPEFAYLPKKSALTVERLLAAGALCLGKTNMDQFATGLVGTRSPYGACRNVFNPSYLAGGSSSGSAVAVAGGHVSFSLGTDTAGSGRVPAALGNIVGVKPTRGSLSTEGVVPACASLDCVSVFALSVADGAALRELMLGNANVPKAARAQLAGLRVAVPDRLEFFGDYGASFRFTSVITALRELGAEIAEIDWSPFEQIGNLLYGGPWVAERTLAVGDFIRMNPDACLPVTREIIMSGERYGGLDVLRAQHQLASLTSQVRRLFDGMDVMLVPTTPTIFTLAEEASDPRGQNDRMGIYTRFANFLGWPALSIPAGFKPDGLPFGVSLLMRAHEDRKLDHVGATLERVLHQATRPSTAAISGMRTRTRATLPSMPAVSVGVSVGAAPSSSPPAQPAALPGYVRLAVVGAHLRGQPLNHELTSARARFVRATRTAPCYRLYALEGTVPPKPGLARVSSGGAAIEIELWDMPVAAFGAFVAKIPPPLGIGTLLCEDGEQVKGFLCETHALEKAQDISAFGGFKAYLAHKS
jgi:allophanate hydrolase